MCLKPALLPYTVFAVLSFVFLAMVAFLPGSTMAATMHLPASRAAAKAPMVQAIASRPRAGADKSMPSRPSTPSRSSTASRSMPSWPAPEIVMARPHLDLSDEIATLRALQLALNDVGDGSSYVWQRRNGRLSGIIMPTASFRDSKGQVCRHIVVWLTAGTRTKKTETIACRQADRVWTFEG